MIVRGHSQLQPGWRRQGRAVSTAFIEPIAAQAGYLLTGNGCLLLGMTGDLARGSREKEMKGRTDRDC
jgi:hypothetical protein